MNLTLETDRLLLKPLTRDDLEDIWPFLSDPSIPEFMAWEHHKTKQETIDFLGRVVNDINTDKAYHWGIYINKKTLCGLFSIIAVLRKHRSLIYDRGELAYWIGSKFRGKGIMTEAGKTIIDFSFNELKLHRLVVSHFTENNASEKLIQRLNFNYIGEEHDSFFKNGKWWNHKLYELTINDWKK